MSHRATSAAASTVGAAGQIRGVMTGRMLGMFWPPSTRRSLPRRSSAPWAAPPLQPCSSRCCSASRRTGSPPHAGVRGEQPDFIGALREPATRADPANAPPLALFRGGSSGGLGPDSLNDTSWLRHANGVLAHPIKDGFYQAVDAVMLAADALVFVALLVTLALPNVRPRDPQLAAREAAAG